MAIMLVAVAIIASSAYERVTQEVVTQRDTELARVSAMRLSEGLTQYSRFLLNIAVEEEIRSMEVAGLSSALKKAQAWLYFFDAGFVVIAISSKNPLIILYNLVSLSQSVIKPSQI